MAYTLLDSAYQLHNSSAEFAALGGKKTGLLRRTGRFLNRNKGKLALAGAAGLGLAAVANRKKIGGALRTTARRYEKAAGDEMTKTYHAAIQPGAGISEKGMNQALRRGLKNEAKKDIGRAVSKVKSFNPFRKK